MGLGHRDRDEATGPFAIEQDPAMGHWIVWDDEGRPVYFANDKQDAQRVQNGLNDGSLNKEDLDG